MKTGRVGKILLAVVAVLVFALAPVAAKAQEVDGIYFRETGHWVKGDFLTFYQSVENPQLVFGYPLTDSFKDTKTGLNVQYFQRARFEQHPESPPELRIQLSLLGEFLHEPTNSPLPIPENFPSCRTFPLIEFQVCYTFLDFFEENGGVGLFGYPISNFELENGRIVQYFQRARFEWHPEAAAGERVVLGNLGDEYFDKHNEDPERKRPNRENYTHDLIISLKAHAFPVQAVTGMKGEQRVFIIVQDQTLMPVANARVSVTVTLPDGQVLGTYNPPDTNQDGVTEIKFPFTSAQRGLAKVVVNVQYGQMVTKTQSSFRIWW